MEQHLQENPINPDQKTKLFRLDEKRNNIALLIRKSEELIDYGQPTFFRVAMDVQMRNVVSDVKLQLFAIVESAKYQNIPRTIQNVFLNSKLDADFIKDTIVTDL